MRIALRSPANKAQARMMAMGGYRRDAAGLNTLPLAPIGSAPMGKEKPPGAGKSPPTLRDVGSSPFTGKILPDPVAATTRRYIETKHHRRRRSHGGSPGLQSNQR